MTDQTEPQKSKWEETDRLVEAMCGPLGDYLARSTDAERACSVVFSGSIKLAAVMLVVCQRLMEFEEISPVAPPEYGDMVASRMAALRSLEAGELSDA
ncbi:MAG TPA: hypothetical protein VNH21_13570 [Steroidobacteraceae bacterium]|nr:hypothetical protein [Steroidobacteraceae bacterium]